MSSLFTFLNASYCAERILCLIKLRNPRPLGVVRDNWLCLLSAQWYLQMWSCPNNLNKGETDEQISKAITCNMALPYHNVWVPKYRHRILTGVVGREVTNCINVFAGQLGFAQK